MVRRQVLSSDVCGDKGFHLGVLDSRMIGLGLGENSEIWKWRNPFPLSFIFGNLLHIISVFFSEKKEKTEKKKKR